MTDKILKYDSESQNEPSSKAEIDISRLPSEVAAAYTSASSQFVGKAALDEATLERWKLLGVEMAAQSTRSWEAAVAYFEESPTIKKRLGTSQFVRWGEMGMEFVLLSPPLASAYFRASTRSLEKSLSPRHMEEWGETCKNLYSGTWKSGTLVCNLFEFSPTLLTALSQDQFRLFVEFLGILASRSVEIADRTLESSATLLPKFGVNAYSFVELSHTVASRSWRDVQSLYKSSEQFLLPLEAEQQDFILKLMKQTVKTEGLKVPPLQIMQNGAAALSLFGYSEQTKLFNVIHRLFNTSSEAANGFLASIPSIKDRLNFEQIEAWSNHGIDSARGNAKVANEYFNLRTNEAVNMLEGLSSGVELKSLESVLRMYSRALSGRPIEIKATEQLVEKHIGWFHKDMPATEGETVYLPSSVNQETTKKGNFSFYKVMTTHQTGHIEFGSFDFEFEKEGDIFENMRSKIEEAQISAGTVRAKQEHPEEDKGGTPLTNIGRFFALFSDNRLARDLFEIVESARVDTCISEFYRGIAKAYRRVQNIAISARPDIRKLPAKEALIELLVRISLGQVSDLYVPSEHEEIAKKMRRLIRKSANKDASVEDSAEATVRIYALLADVENEELETDQFNNLPEDEHLESPDKEEGGLEEDMMPDEFILRQLMLGMNASDSADDGSGGGGDAEQSGGDYESPQQVDYRGDFKPELTQIMNMLQEGVLNGTGKDVSLTPEQLEEMLKNAPEAKETEEAEGEGLNAEEAAQISKNMLKNLQNKGVTTQMQGDSNNPSHIDEDDSPLEATEPNSYLYDEWDFRTGEYKKSWCLLREKESSVGEPSFYREVLAKNIMLVREIRTQFEMIAPELARKHKRLADGEEADFDSALEAMIDIRAKKSPDERIYWRRNKTERSVAVVFLLDMSASTAEAIEDSKPTADDWSAPDDPTEYMAWLRSRRGKGGARGYKRIIDVEKDGVVLLVNALETLGDHYGIYGFSGYGRDNVEFYIIKDIEEKFDLNLTSGRIDRIAPLHATRMGPAIRHAATKLARHEAKTKYLFLISDGRPQDRGYSREGVEKEYAVHDTRKALQEARNEGIKPFCLTVDKSGHDYLKTMMEDFNYEVLSDIRLLPKRLLQLYKTFTA